MNRVSQWLRNGCNYSADGGGEGNGQYKAVGKRPAEEIEHSSFELSVWGPYKQSQLYSLKKIFWEFINACRITTELKLESAIAPVYCQALALLNP